MEKEDKELVRAVEVLEEEVLIEMEALEEDGQEVVHLHRGFVTDL